MRISDWSSDVCSSDLERIERSHLEFHGQNSGELCHGDGLEAPERRRDRGFGVIPATKRRRAPMDIRQPGRFLRSRVGAAMAAPTNSRSEEHKSELQALMRISYAVLRLQKNTNNI